MSDARFCRRCALLLNMDAAMEVDAARAKIMEAVVAYGGEPGFRSRLRQVEAKEPLRMAP